MEQPDQQEWGISEVLLFIGLGLPVFLVSFTVLAWLLAAAGVHAKGARLLLAQTGAYLFLLGPLWLVFQKRFDRNPLSMLRMGVSGRDAASAFPAGLLTAIAILVLSVVLRMPHVETPMEELLSDPVSLIAAAILGTTVAPWFEELLFRGLIQPVAVKATGVAAGIVLAALPFALLHLPQYAWSWRHMLLITVAGAAFGWRRHRTGSTGAAWVMHAAYNLLLFTGFIAGRWAGAGVTRSI